MLIEDLVDYLYLTVVIACARQDITNTRIIPSRANARGDSEGGTESRIKNIKHLHRGCLAEGGLSSLPVH